MFKKLTQKARKFLCGVLAVAMCMTTLSSLGAVTAMADPAEDGGYTVTLAQTDGGVVSFDGIEGDTAAFAKGDEVALSVAPDDGYAFSGITLSDTDTGEVAAEDTDVDDTVGYTFTMPAEDITVTAEFEEDDTDNETNDEGASEKITQTIEEETPSDNALDVKTLNDIITFTVSSTITTWHGTVMPSGTKVPDADIDPDLYNSIQHYGLTHNRFNSDKSKLGNSSVTVEEVESTSGAYYLAIKGYSSLSKSKLDTSEPIATLWFDNVATVNGEQINAELVFEKITNAGDVLGDSNITLKDSYAQGDYNCFYWFGGCQVVGDAVSKKDVYYTVTLYYANGKQVDFPVWFCFSDIDQVAPALSNYDYLERVLIDYNKIYSGAYRWFVWPECELSAYMYGTNVLDLHYTSSDGDFTGVDSYKKGGFILAANTGTLSAGTQVGGNCGNGIHVFSELNPAPEKSVTSGDKYYQYGDTVSFDVTKKMNKFYEDIFDTYSSLEIVDEIPEELTYTDDSAKVWFDKNGNGIEESGEDITNDSSVGTLTYAKSSETGISGTLTYTFKKTWLSPDSDNLQTIYCGNYIHMEFDTTVTTEFTSDATITNTAYAIASGIEYGPAEADVKVTIPQMQITKAADSAQYNAGDTVTYTLTVNQTNTNIDECSNVVVSDTLPSELTLDSVTAEGGTVSKSGNSFTVTYDTFKTSDTATVTVMATAVSAGSAIKNTAYVTVDNGDGDDGSATIEVIALGSLEVTKTMTPAGATKNNTWTFTLSGTSNSGVAVNETKTLTGAGTVTFEDILAGDNYTLTEECDSDYWTPQTTKVKITAGQTTEVTIDNVATTGTAKVEKVVVDPSGEYGSNLSGFKFTLTGTSDIGTSVNLTGTTDRSGYITFDDLYPGKYTLTETETPDGNGSIASWWETEGPWQVTVEKDKTTTVTATNTYKTGDVKIIKTMDPADATKWNNWTFTLYGTSDSGESINRTVGLSGAGEATFKDVPIGTYTISESGESSYWELYTGTVTVKTGETVEVKIDNVATTGKVKITKTVTDPSGRYDGTLAGFEFNLTGTSDIGTKVNKTVTTGSDGKVEFEVYPGEYTLTETGSPDSTGYGSWWDNDGPWTVDVSYNRTTSIDVVNIYETGDLTVTKSMDPAGANKNDTWTFTLHGTSDSGLSINESETFSGAGSATFSDIPVGTYTLDEDFNSALWGSSAASQTVKIGYNTTTKVDITNTATTGTAKVQKVVTDPSGLYPYGLDGFTFSLEGTSDIGVDIDMTGTTDADGVVIFDDVYPGEYTLTETGTPDEAKGLMARIASWFAASNVPDWWDTDKTWQVTVEKDKTTTVTAENIYKTGDIELTKAMDPEDANANNTWTFTLEGVSDSGVDVYKERTLTGAGSVSFNDVPIGTYTLTEDFDSDLWESSTKTQTVEVGYKGTTAVLITNTATEGDAEVQKVITDPSGLYENGLGGYTFNLKGTSEIGIDIDLTATSNEDGIVDFLGVYPGTYTLTEVGTEGADEILPWWDTEGEWEVVVVKDDTATIEAENIYKTGDIGIQKSIVKYEESGRALSGFAFHLTGVADDGVDVDWYAVTDDDGYALFKDVPIGSDYTVTEVSKEDVEAAAQAGNESAAAALDLITQDMSEYLNIDAQGEIAVEYGETTDLAFENEVRPALDITKTADGHRYNVGDTVTYTIEAIQTIPGGTSRDVVIEDDIPTGLVLLEDPILEGVEGTVEVHALAGEEEGDGTTYSFTASIPYLAYGETAVITVKVVAASSIVGTTPVNTVRASDWIGNDVTDDEEVEILRPELSIKKEADSTTYSLSDTVTYTITVSQTVEDAFARNVIVSDALPTELELEKVTASNVKAEITKDNNAFTVRYDEMAYDEPEVITVTAKAVADGEEIVNTATANADYTDRVEDDWSVSVREPDISIIKEADKTDYDPGETVTYTITIRNEQEDSTAYNVILRDELPDELDCKKVEITDGAKGSIEITDNGFIATYETLDYDEFSTVTVTAKIDESADDIDVTNTAYVNSDNTDEISDYAKIHVNDPPAPAATVKTGQTAGGIIAGIAAVLAAAGIVLVARRRRRRMW